MQPRPLTEADLPRALALSAGAGWNQTVADWRVFLRDGAVCVLDDGDAASLAGSAAVLPFGPGLAWISMVLVRPDRRREGLATALLRWAMGRLDGTPCIALDATPEGRAVYRRLGFEDGLGFSRWRLAGPLPASRVAVRRLREADWPALLACDLAAFGAGREALLRGFAGRLPDAAWIAEDGSGFALGRDGHRLPQIGPVVATHPAAAQALIAAAARAVGGPVLLDLADQAAGLLGGATTAGAQHLRPFTRMTRGATPPGAAGLFAAMAGPEFG